MIWYLTKGNHNLAIKPWVRWWLRTGGFGRFMVVFVIFLVLLGLTMATAAINLLSQYSLSGGPQFLQLIAAVVNFVCKLGMVLLWVAWIVDSIMDRKISRDDIKRMMGLPSVVLATRGEYIGGHPQLPHGRFVYLTLGGTLENPQLNIVLPQAEGRPDDIFTMPVLDLQKTTQQVEKTGDETTINVTLASVTFRAKFLGEQATLNTEYIGQAGRKQVVEITRFLFGNSEVQTWRNYIVCIQAEADTGKPPYGPWKSLPAGKPSSSGDELGKSIPNAAASLKTASSRVSAASAPPERAARVVDAKSSPLNTENPTPIATPPVERPKPPVSTQTEASPPSQTQDSQSSQLVTKEIGSEAFCSAFSVDGKLLVVGTGAGIRFFDSESLAEKDRIKTDTAVYGLAFSPDGRMLAAALADRTVRMRRFPEGDPVNILGGHSDAVWSVAFSPDGKVLASGSDDKTVRLWQASTGNTLMVLTEHKSLVRSVAFSPDGKILASGAGSPDDTVRLWRVADGTLLRILEGHRFGVRSIAFFHNGQVLAVGAEDGRVRLWRISDGVLVSSFKGFRCGVASVAVSPDDEIVASGSMDNTVRLWRVANGELAETLQGHKSGVKSVLFSMDGREMVSVEKNGTMTLWQVGE